MPAFELIVVLGATLLAAIMSASVTRSIRPLLVRYALARPNARSSHVTPTPQGAGIAVVAATLASSALAMLLLPDAARVSMLAVFAATVAIAAVGAVDDLHPLSVAPRLLLQAAAVGAILLSAPADLRLVEQSPIWVERGVLLLAGLWFVNLVNFMDGLDWMTVAEVIPLTATLVLIGMFGEMSRPAMLVAAALGGATAGFAPFNRPVAKIFLGDVGSLPIGLLLAWCFFDLAGHRHLAAALLLPLYYLADASLTLARRLAKGEKVWLAHRSHFYQRATDNGFAVIDVVTQVFVLNIVLSMLAALSVYLHAATADAVLLALGLTAVAFVLRRFARPRR